MKHSFLLILMSFCIALCACQERTQTSSEQGCMDSEKAIDSVIICWQPYGDFTPKEVTKLQEAFIEHFCPMIKTKITFKTLPTRKLTKDMLNDAKTRYRASKILDGQKGHKGVIIGLIHRDISTTIHGKKDYGILGLSYQGKNNSIVSDFRVHRKKDLWKVASHEFIHAYFNYGHCSKDDSTCIMKDAKGKGNLPKQYHLCKYCSEHIFK